MKSSRFLSLDRRGDALERGIVLDLANDLTLAKRKIQLLINNYGEPFLVPIMAALDNIMVETVVKLGETNKSLSASQDIEKRTMTEMTKCALVERIKTLEELRRRMQFAREQHAEKIRLYRRSGSPI